MLNAIVPVEAILLAAAEGLLDAVAVGRGIDHEERRLSRIEETGCVRDDPNSIVEPALANLFLEPRAPAEAGKWRGRGRGRVARDQDGEKKRKHGWSVAG